MPKCRTLRILLLITFSTNRRPLHHLQLTDGGVILVFLGSHHRPFHWSTNTIPGIQLRTRSDKGIKEPGLRLKVSANQSNWASCPLTASPASSSRPGTNEACHPQTI